MEIVFLGTGGSFPSPQRGVSSVAVKTHGDILLFDCGEGTQRQLMRSPLSFMGITKIFITHFHGDHYLGLPGLLQTMALNGRTRDLEIYGPKGTEQLVTILERISYYSRTYDLVIHEMREGQVEYFDQFKITAIRLDHSIPTLGYILEENERPGKFDTNAAKLLGIPPGPLYSKLQKGEEVVFDGRLIEPAMVLGPPRPGRKVCIAMDTKPVIALPDMIKEADVLVHEATADRSLEGKANKFGHSTAAQAATIAKEAEVKRLFLIHISPRYREPKLLIDEARSIFEESYLPSDLETYEVPLPESWKEDRKLWVVEDQEEGEAEGYEEATGDGEELAQLYADGTASVGDEDVPPVTDLGEYVESEDTGIYTEVTADGATADGAAADGAAVEGASDVPEGGVSLNVVEAAMEGRTSPTSLVDSSEEELGQVSEVPEAEPEDDDDEFDLERAMLEAGIDPDAELE